MAEPIENRAFKYLTVVLILVSLIILISKIFLETGYFTLPPEEKITQPPVPIKIGWDVLRKPLQIVAPEIKVSLQVDPGTTSPSSTVSLMAEVLGPVEAFFKYRFDCQGDGYYEFVTGTTTPLKKYTAENKCVYGQEGTYKPQVEVEAEITYFKGDEEVTEIFKGTSQGQVIVGDFSPPPQLASCDISAEKGTTQKNFVFGFSAETANPRDSEVFAYQWDFGDGKTATMDVATVNGRNYFEVTHNYRQPGMYVPKVTIKDNKGRTNTCIVYKLLGLKDLGSFETLKMPPIEDIGREDPFDPVR